MCVYVYASMLMCVCRAFSAQSMVLGNESGDTEDAVSTCPGCGQVFAKPFRLKLLCLTGAAEHTNSSEWSRSCCSIMLFSRVNLGVIMTIESSCEKKKT